MSPSNTNPEADYEIGYGKPPVRTRFQKGCSGNPRGRPTNAKNLATVLAAALDERVSVVENGRRKKKTKRDVIVAQLVNRSASADLKAIGILIGLLHRVEHEHPVSAVADDLAEADLKVLQNLGQYLKQKGRDSDD